MDKLLLIRKILRVINDFLDQFVVLWWVVFLATMVVGYHLLTPITAFAVFIAVLGVRIEKHMRQIARSLRDDNAQS